MASSPDQANKDDMSENNDADSNSSDVLATENKNRQAKKKTLSDMLKKLNPEGDDSISLQELPDFLLKNSRQMSLEMTCNNDPELPPSQEPAAATEIKTTTESKSVNSNSLPSQARVSSPKSSAEVYKCFVDKCFSAFSQINDFKQHILTLHSNAPTIPCCFCYSTYKHDNIFDHLSLHIKNVMKCIYCQVSQDTREELLKHLSDKHPNQPKKINVCIRILNNVRSRKPSSEQNQEPKISEKLQPAAVSSVQADEKTDSAPAAEVPKSRNPRKSAKPLKTQILMTTDEVEVKSPDKDLPVNCGQCSFTCNTESHLKQHTKEGHTTPCNDSSLFKCKQCKTATDCKDSFQIHLAHHKGNHTIRYYLCPYCPLVSNSMDTIEDHVGEKHPTEAFRFEVLQEKIDYLQNMLVCPVCNGAYVWQKSFLNHLESVHKLKDLVNHLSKSYDEKAMPNKPKVLRSYFRNLLPDAPDCDTELLNTKGAQPIQVDGDGDNAVRKDSAHLDFSCDTCDFQASNAVDLKEHTSTHESQLADKQDSQDEDYSGMFADGVEFSERFPPADLSQYVIKKGTPTMFSCDMCPFECVKTAHFRRHLEVHKRNESLTEGYKCGYCQFMHNRLNCIRFHLGKYHGDKPYKMTRILDNSIISYGPEDDPTLIKSKAKKSFVTSTPILKSEREKRTSYKFGGISCQSLNSSTSESDLQMILQFEKQLPTAMIYQDPVKCPKCDFSNRVRINLLRHLKLHKEERVVNGSLNDQSVSGQVEEDEANGMETDDNDRNSLNPLLNFLSNKKGSSCDGDFLEDAEEVTFVSRTDLTDEYKYFSIKLSGGNQYQCKECKFIHRYPSKVKRHYYYKHAPAFPFKCGYCSFGAVESGKVKRHCKLVHKHKREMVIKRNVYKKDAQAASATSQPSTCKVEPVKEVIVPKPEVDEEDGVKVANEVITNSAPDASGDLWLPQFVTMLDDDVQCCKLCGYQQEGSSSLRDHVFYMHLEFYPYSCTYCGFALMDIFRVKKHIDMHHTNMPYVAVKRQIKDVADEGVDNSTGDMIIDETSQLSSNLDGSVKKEPEEEDDEVEGEQNETSAGRDMLDESDPSGANNKRQFKCHYCGVISKWNRRDIRLHILHVHLRKKVYTCRHCGFGNSKSKAVVKSHCIKFHPSKNVSVRDELVLFNAIIPIDDSHGIVTMALSNKDGIPILELPNEEEAEKAVKGFSKTPTVTVKTEPKVTRSVSNLNNSSGASNTSNGKTSSSYLKSDKWKCKECGYASNSEIDVKYHIIASHMNLKPYSCPHCHLYMNKVESVSAHIDKVHSGKHKNVVNTIDEKATYLQRNMECLFGPSESNTMINEDEDVIDANFARIMEQQTNPRYSSGYFRCLICGYRDPRNDKTKYHIIKTHLNLRQFSCPHCNLYMWGRQQVIIHIEEAHPGKEVFVKRTFQEYDEYLRKSIKRFPYPRSIGLTQPDSSLKITTKAIPRIHCDSCSFVTDSELSLAAHKRTHRIFQCFYCEFKHMLAARVQSHCLARHPYKLVRFKQINSSNFESTKVDGANAGGDNSEESEVEFEKEDADGSKIDKSQNNGSGGTYICQHCQLVKWNKSDISKHLAEAHPGNTPAYTFIKTNVDEPVKILKTCDSAKDDEDDEDDNEDGEEDMEVDEKAGDLPIKMNNVQNTKFSNLSAQLCKSRASLYQCKLCTYKSNKMTVMRHHVMSHLRYHPYLCPYCDVARSVKSFPIKKHVMAKHPGKEVRSLHCVNEEIEKKISNSYFKIKLSSLAGDNFLENHENNFEDEEEEDEDEDGGSQNEECTPQPPFLSESNVNIFKCKFCDFETSIKTDMKHHLMKEINYKPLKCSNCVYAETQRPAISKHYQVKHPGCEVKIKEEVNAEKEELVRKMLEETIVKKKTETSETQSSKQTTHNTRFSLGQRLSSFSPPPQPQQLKQLLNPIPLKAGSKILKCPECSYTNSSMKLVRGHMIKHGPYRFKCSYCDYRAHYPSRIRKHTKTQHQGLAFKFTKVMDYPSQLNTKNEPIAFNASNASVLQSDSANAVYLDGVLMDLPFFAHPDGWYRCQFCDYKSLDRDNFKVHLVTHRPPRWKCYHCSQKYPVVFRVRRHCITKHPKLSIKWVDIETGRIYSNSKSFGSFMPNALYMLASSSANRQCTARKSMAVSDSGFSFSEDQGLTESSLFPINHWGSNDGAIKFCCHLCNFVEYSQTGLNLFIHLKVEHFWVDKLPSIEILPTGDDGEVWALRRCGFCAFETYDSEAFHCHVLKHTICPPVQCSFCSFASFSRSLVVDHAKTQHETEVSLLLDGIDRESKIHSVSNIETLQKDSNDVDVTAGEERPEGGEGARSNDGKVEVMETSTENETKQLSLPDHLLYKDLKEAYIMSAQDDSGQYLSWSDDFEVSVKLVDVLPKDVDMFESLI